MLVRSPRLTYSRPEGLTSASPRSRPQCCVQCSFILAADPQPAGSAVGSPMLTTDNCATVFRQGPRGGRPHKKSQNLDIVNHTAAWRLNDARCSRSRFGWYSPRCMDRAMGSAFEKEVHYTRRRELSLIDRMQRVRGRQTPLNIRRQGADGE